MPQFELFDHKPLLNKMRGEDLPESVRNGQRLTGMTSNQEKSQHSLTEKTSHLDTT